MNQLYLLSYLGYGPLILICCPCSGGETARQHKFSQDDATVIQQYCESTLKGNTLFYWCGCFGPMKCTAGVQTSLIVGVALSLEVEWTVFSHKFLSEPLCRQFSLSRLFSLRGVLWMFAASAPLVCNACCGPSVGVFYSSLPPAVQPQNKRV